MYSQYYLQEHTAYVLSWNRGKNLYFFSHILITLGKDVTSLLITKKMGEFGGQNAHSTLNTDCEPEV